MQDLEKKTNLIQFFDDLFLDKSLKNLLNSFFTPIFIFFFEYILKKKLINEIIRKNKMNVHFLRDIQ